MKKRLIIFGSIFLVSLTIFIVFLVLIAKTNGLELGVDTFFKNLAYDTRGKKGGFVYLLFRIITEAGDKYIIAVLLILGLVYTRLDKRYLCFFIGIVLEVSLNTVFKHIYQRERPDELMRWMVDESSSFPSGHSSACGMIYPYIIYTFIVSKDKKALKLPVIITSGVLLVLVPISRIILGMHYFSDVFAGIALGALVSSCVMVLTEVLGYYNILPEGILHFKKKTEEAKEE